MSDFSWRWAVVSRVAAAIVGGYMVANAVPVALVAMLSLDRAESAMLSMYGSFAVYIMAVIWVFGARNARRAWLGLLVCFGLSLLLLSVQWAWS